MNAKFHYHYCALLFRSNEEPLYIDGMLSLNEPVVNNEDYIKVKEMVGGQGRSYQIVFLSFSQHFDFGYGGNFSMSYSLKNQKLTDKEVKLFKEFEITPPR